MKTITINLTPEQEEVLLARIDQTINGLFKTDHKYLDKFKNPSEDTKKRIFEVKKKWARVVRENEIAEGFIKQIQEQLNKKPSVYLPELKEVLDKEVPDEKVEEIFKRGGLDNHD